MCVGSKCDVKWDWIVGDKYQVKKVCRLASQELVDGLSEGRKNIVNERDQPPTPPTINSLSLSSSSPERKKKLLPIHRPTTLSLFSTSPECVTSQSTYYCMYLYQCGNACEFETCGAQAVNVA